MRTADDAVRYGDGLRAFLLQKLQRLAYDRGVIADILSRVSQPPANPLGGTRLTEPLFPNLSNAFRLSRFRNP
jgi:hypothetical protein